MPPQGARTNSATGISDEFADRASAAVDAGEVSEGDRTVHVGNVERRSRTRLLAAFVALTKLKRFDEALAWNYPARERSARRRRRYLAATRSARSSGRPTSRSMRDRLVHEQGEVMGQGEANGSTTWRSSSRTTATRPLATLSRSPPPPLPGGYKVGEKLYYIGASQTVDNGDRLVHDEQGEVMGPGKSNGRAPADRVPKRATSLARSTRCHRRRRRCLAATRSARSSITSEQATFETATVACTASRVR